MYMRHDSSKTLALYKSLTYLLTSFYKITKREHNVVEKDESIVSIVQREQNII